MYYFICLFVAGENGFVEAVIFEVGSLVNRTHAQPAVGKTLNSHNVFVCSFQQFDRSGNEDGFGIFAQIIAKP